MGPVALQSEPREAEGSHAAGSGRARCGWHRAPGPVETHPLLLPGGKGLSFWSGLCKQHLFHNVFLTTPFLRTGNNPINFIISAEEEQGYRFALKFNELSS